MCSYFYLFSDSTYLPFIHPSFLACFPPSLLPSFFPSFLPEQVFQFLPLRFFVCYLANLRVESYLKLFFRSKSILPTLPVSYHVWPPQCRFSAEIIVDWCLPINTYSLVSIQWTCTTFKTPLVPLVHKTPHVEYICFAVCRRDSSNGRFQNTTFFKSS